jgi:hypothetical protein
VPPSRVWVFSERITFYPSGVNRKAAVPPDDSLAGAGLFTSRSAAIAIAPAGLPVGEFDAWMEGC